MVDEARGGASPELAATMVGAKLPPPTPPAPRPSTPLAAKSGPAAVTPMAPARGSNTLMLVAIGFAVVLLVGTLVLFFFLLLGRG
jgi:hypothetical protein